MGITEVSIMEAILIAVSGLLVVFVMLGILSAVIMVIARLIPAEGSGRAEKSGAAAAEASADAVQPASGSDHAPSVPYGGTIKLLDVDEKTAACVMAIVSHETKIPLDQLVFKSIKALNE